MAKCTDIDDREDESSCGHICINSPGSYVCACNSGYELNEDEIFCVYLIGTCLFTLYLDNGFTLNCFVLTIQDKDF